MIARNVLHPTMVAVLVALAGMLAGCLEAEKTVQVRYDKDKDEFTYLVVYQRIRNGKDQKGKTDPAADLKHLTALYQNRDHLLIGPAGSPRPLEEWGEDGWLRLSPELAAIVDLDSAKLNLATTRPGIPLDQVQVKPGRLFVGEGGGLCYYHQITVPGKVVEAAMAIGPSRARDNDMVKRISGMIGGELARRSGGGAPMTLQEAKEKLVPLLVQQLTREMVDADAQPGKLPVGFPFSDAGLKALRDAYEKGQVATQRRGSQVFVRLRLTEADAADAVALLDELQKQIEATLQDQTKIIPKSIRTAQALRKLAAGLKRTVVEKDTLELSMDLVDLMGLFDKPADPLKEVEPDALERAKTFAVQVTGQLDVAKDVTIQQIVADFAAGKLAGNPSKPPVQPGTGLGQIDGPPAP
jgi:hypothetical protein